MKKILLGTALACFGLAANSSAQTIALTQNFEGGLGTWTNNVTGGGTGWTIASAATPTQLGAIPAHTKYAVIDEGSLTGTAYNNPAKLTSPTFSLAGVTNPYLSYDAYYFEAHLGSTGPYERGWVQISTDGGTVWNTIDSMKYNGYPSGTFSTNWITKFVSLSTYAGSATCQLQFVYKDNAGHIIGAGIDNVLVYGAVASDVGLASVTPVAGSANSYYKVNSPVTFAGTATNFGTAAITSITANYQVGAAAPVSNTIATSIAPFSSGNFTFTTPYNMSSIGNKNVKVWITTAGETYLANDSASTTVTGIAFKPKKRVVFEEATGTWCGFCVRGIVYMDSLWRADSNHVNIVSVHNSDPMASENASTTAYDNLIGNYITGYPSMVVDRRYKTDPSNAFAAFLQDSSLYGFVNMGVTATVSGSSITPTVKVETPVDMSGDYRLSLVVTEEEVSGPAGSSWDQHNYYNGGGYGPLQTIGYNFVTLPAVIPNVKYPFVARITIPADLSTTPNGEPGSLPSSMHVGNTYTWTPPAITIPSNWNSSHLRVIAMFLDNNPANATYGQILNSVSTSQQAFTWINVGVKNVNATAIANVELFPNPTQDEAHLRFSLSSASTVHFEVYDAVGRQVFSAPAEQMAEGNHQINFSTADYATGIYNVIVRTENGQISQRLSVIK